jgi:hypothetical protein
MKKNILLIFIILYFVSQGSGQTNTLPSNDSVGIGTVNPSEILEIEDGYLSIYHNHAGSGAGYALRFKTNGGSFKNTQAQIGLSQTTTNNPGASLLFYTHNGTSLEERMRLSAVGNLGINTPSPGAKLGIQSTGTGITSILLANNNNSTGDYNQIKFQHSQSDATYGAAIRQIIKASDLHGGVLSFLTDNSTGVLTERMRIDVSGNVGIGTSQPSQKLSVDGNIYAEGNISANGFITTRKLTVTQLGWSDYVFAKKYKLRSLLSLETFIKLNNHLPEMPSAKQVEREGISVGDTQALLLKKIEELTLYLIDLNRKNQELNKRIQTLEQKIRN